MDELFVLVSAAGTVWKSTSEATLFVVGMIMQTLISGKEQLREMASNLVDALRLLEKGYSVVPLKPRSKEPLVEWKSYQATRASKETVESWFKDRSDLGIAIVTGEISGVVVLDVDQPDSVKWRKELDELDEMTTPIVKTRRGYHYYFKYPDGMEVPSFSIEGLGDFQSDGKLVTVPPSIHEKGTRYEWVHEGNPKPAEMPNWLMELIWKKRATEYKPKEVEYGSGVTTAYGVKWFEDVEELEKTKEGGRNNLLNEVATKAGSLIASGHLDTGEARKAMEQACKWNGLEKEDGYYSIEKTIDSGIKAGMKSPRGPERSGSNQIGSLKIRKASEIKPEPVNWLWEGVIAKGALMLLAGDPGLGKSQVTLSIAAAISIGGNWPASTSRAEKANVVILSTEDSPKNTIIPRLIACGADLERTLIVESIQDDRGDRPFVLQDDVPKLRQKIEAIGSVSLVIIDPVTNYMGKGDANSTTDVRGVLGQLSDLARECDIAVVLVSHLNKDAGKKATNRVTGSGAWVAAARTAYAIERDGEDGEIRKMAPIKNNLAKDTVGFRYRVESCKVEGGIETSRVVWNDTSEVLTADQAFNDRQSGPARSEAKEFLREMLASGPCVPKEVKALAESEGIHDSTLKRAKRELKVQLNKQRMWCLPEENGKTTEPWEVNFDTVT